MVFLILTACFLGTPICVSQIFEAPSFEACEAQISPALERLKEKFPAATHAVQVQCLRGEDDERDA